MEKRTERTAYNAKEGKAFEKLISSNYKHKIIFAKCLHNYWTMVKLLLDFFCTEYAYIYIYYTIRMYFYDIRIINNVYYSNHGF